MGPGSAADGEADADGLWVSLYVHYESGTVRGVDTRKAREIEGMRPLLRALIAHHDSLF